MAETPLVAFAIAACGTITLLILVRALRDILAGQHEHEVER